jgi:hypothetical protein
VGLVSLLQDTAGLVSLLQDTVGHDCVSLQHLHRLLLAYMQAPVVCVYTTYLTGGSLLEVLQQCLLLLVGLVLLALQVQTV